MRKAAPDEELAGLAREIEQAQPEKADGEKRQPKRAPLLTRLPRREVRHEPANTTASAAAR